MPSMLHAVANSVMGRIRRSPFYYERYNNTCDFTTNRNYTRYARECREAYKAQGAAADLPPSPLWQNAATLIPGAYPADKAHALSGKIGELIERNDPCVKHVQNEGRSLHIQQPLAALGTDVLDVLRSPEVEKGLLSFFRGHYRVEWITCFRSLPADTVAGSWLWHSDSFPPHTCKMFLHLTKTTADTGATEFMNRQDTMAYRRAGYFGQFQNERYANLQDFARAHDLPYRPYHFDAEPGDVTLFDMNFFHRAVSPRAGYRDVVCFLFFPNAVSWEKQLENGGLETLVRRGPGKLPRDPRPGAVSAVTQAMA